MKRLCKLVFLVAALINPAFMYTGSNLTIFANVAWSPGYRIVGQVDSLPAHHEITPTQDAS